MDITIQDGATKSPTQTTKPLLDSHLLSQPQEPSETEKEKPRKPAKPLKDEWRGRWITTTRPNVLGPGPGGSTIKVRSAAIKKKGFVGFMDGKKAQVGPNKKLTKSQKRLLATFKVIDEGRDRDSMSLSRARFPKRQRTFAEGGEVGDEDDEDDEDEEELEDANEDEEGSVLAPSPSQSATIKLEKALQAVCDSRMKDVEERLYKIVVEFDKGSNILSNGWFDAILRGVIKRQCDKVSSAVARAASAALAAKDEEIRHLKARLAQYEFPNQEDKSNEMMEIMDGLGSLRYHEG